MPKLGAELDPKLGPELGGELAPGSGALPPAPIVALVGLAGTGKSTFVARLAARTGWPVVYFGGVVMDQLAQQGLAVTPQNEEQVRNALRARHGPACIAITALAPYEDAENRPLIIDGLYSYAELKFLEQRFGPRLHSIATHAPFALRVSRLGARPTRPLSASQIRARDRSEVEELDKAPPIALAQHHFVNSTSLADMDRFIDQLVPQKAPAGSDAA